ncbi:hypothetical protein Vadar_033789 [Vaccinium darrowii]|uniref:Uncharacterized protein n=1 Tax=Vaccinium darrowii TaxID=229202 RepID=A0ACB7XWX0_9ERIC|nr:hypothetical protein Vadar_033789 [Vaccinium darrowii]
MSQRSVGFSPDVHQKPPVPLPTTFHKKNGRGGKKRRLNGISSFRATGDNPSFSPLVGTILRRIGASVAKALRCGKSWSSSSCKVVSASSTTMARSRSYADYNMIIDSHRAEAVEDCIEFLNSSSSTSSSSLRRSFSVSENTFCS